MTESDSVNPFASPKQPTISSGPTISEPILYEATPTIDDLNSALRSLPSIISTCILLSLFSFGFIATLLFSLFATGPKGGIGIVALPFLFLFFLFYFLVIGAQLYSQVNIVRKHLRINPNATTFLTGELTSEGLRLESEARISWHPHEGLTSCQTKNNQLLLCHDPQGLGVRILPVRGFSNSTQAVQLLEFQANKVSPPPNLQEPVTGPSMIGDPPAGAIVFGGVLKSGDVSKAPLEAIRKQTAKRSFIGIKKTIDPELSLIAFQGWLNETEIASLDNSGHIRVGWKDFQSVGLNDACIWLQRYGFENVFTILPRRFFNDDNQWQTAVRIAASHSTEHTSGSS